MGVRATWRPSPPPASSGRAFPSLFATTGILGGFTAYSTFNYETLELAQSGEPGLAALNVAATVLGGFLAGLAGLAGLALGRALVD